MQLVERSQAHISRLPDGLSPDQFADDPTRRFWSADRRLPVLDGLDMTVGTFRNISFEPHWHDTFQIGLVSDGAKAMLIDGRAHIAIAPSVVVVNPGEIHACASDQGNSWSSALIYPSRQLMQQIVAELGGSATTAPAFDSPVIRDPAAVGQLSAFARAAANGAARLELEIRLLDALRTLLARHARTPIRPLPSRFGRRAARAAITYIHENYQEDTSIADLADLTSVSPYRFGRLFRSEIGLPPHKYLSYVRVMRAKDLIEAGAPLAGVAAEVGFYDQSHLNRHFKRITGVTPGEYAGSRRSRRRTTEPVAL